VAAVLENVADECQRLPRCAVVAMTFVLLQFVGAIKSVGDAIISELLSGRTIIARLGFAATVMPGWLALILYRDVLLKDINVLHAIGRLREPARVGVGGSRPRATS